MADVVDASMCVDCRVNEAAWDCEPPSPGYFSRCSRCSFLSGYDPQGLGQHVHVMAARGTFPAYRTAVNLYPRFADGCCRAGNAGAVAPMNSATTSSRSTTGTGCRSTTGALSPCSTSSPPCTTAAATSPNH